MKKSAVVSAALSLAAHAVAAPLFVGGTVQLSHTPNSADGAMTSSQSPISGTPVSADRLNTGGYSLNGTHIIGTSSSTGKAKAAHVTNVTTASVVLRSGTGVAQIDPANNYSGFSRTQVLMTSPLTWSLGFDANASRYASFTVAGNVGTGGFARFNAALTFTGSANQSLGSINLSTGTITTPGAFTRTLTAAGTMAVPNDGIIRLGGVITFDGSNDEAPTNIDVVDAQFGANYDDTYFYIAEGSAGWQTAANWLPSTTSPMFQTPNGSCRVLFTPDTGDDTVTLFGSASVDSLDVSGNKTVTISRQSGTLSFAGEGPNLRTHNGGGTILLTLPVRVLGQNVLNVAAEDGGTVRLINGLSLGGTPLRGTILKTGDGTLNISGGALPAMDVNAQRGTTFISHPNPLDLNLTARPLLSDTAQLTVSNNTIDVSKINVYTGGTIKLVPFTHLGVAPINTILEGDNLFIETGGVLDVDRAGVRHAPLPGQIDLYDLVQRYVESAYANGAWTGSGITSSMAINDMNHRSGVGYGHDEFGRLVFRWTLYGDASLNGIVDISDFSILAANFNNTGDWKDGDFNFDGVINISDFAQLAGNFNQSAIADLPRGAEVPEPVAVGFISAFAILSRRSRRN